MKEDWENIWYFGMFGSLGLAAVLLYYKPDTRCASISLALSKRRFMPEYVAYKDGR